jgi:hypothetical protein
MDGKGKTNQVTGCGGPSGYEISRLPHFLDSWLRDGKVKDNHVTGCGGPSGCESLRLPHFLDNWLTDGSKVVSLTRWLPFTPRKIPGTHFR